MASAHAAAPGAVRAVIIGGTGFIGRHMCDTFSAEGYDVITVGRSAAPESWPHPHLRLDLMTTPPRRIAKMLSELHPQVIVNASGGIWGLTEEQMAAVIVTPTQRLLAALRAMSGRPRLVHLGSVLEYGPVPEGTTLGPGVPLRPRSRYGQAKSDATRAVLARARWGRVNAIVLRIPNVIGPGAPTVSLLGRSAEQLRHALADGRDAVITLDALLAHRDYVDVRDVADAVLRAARSSVTGVAIDIGRGQAVTVRSIVELLIQVSGVTAEIVERDQTSARLGHSADMWTQVDPRPAFELLGWQPTRSLTEAVTAYWREQVVTS
jgi:nucleoside-diphosphate-sugar epimerase